MVTRYGMSDQVGRIFIDPRKDADGISGNPTLIDKEVKMLIEEAYNGALSLLKEHEHQLHLLANALKEYETLDIDEIRRVLKGEELTERKLMDTEELSQLREKELKRKKDRDHLEE